MKKNVIITLIITSLLTSAFKNKEPNEKQLKIKENEITSQPYKVELIDDKTPQNQNALSLKIANDANITFLKVGAKILFTLPSNVNLENGQILPAGTKFSATVVMKESTLKKTKIKLLINEIIFPDTQNYIILSKVKNIEPLKTINAERILGKHAQITGLYNLSTEISSVSFSQNGIKSEPETTTAIGIGIILNTRAQTIKAGTPVVITFKNNLKPKIQILK